MGQRNGARLQIWAAISFPNFDMVCQSDNGTSLQSLLTSEKINFVCFSFVDDVDLIATEKQAQAPPSTILCNLQKTLDLWETGLCTLGGTLSSTKSRWIVIDFHGRTSGIINQQKNSLALFS